jgi:hypothetical protein
MRLVLEHEIYLKLSCQCNVKFSSAHLRDLSTLLQHESIKNKKLGAEVMQNNCLRTKPMTDQALMVENENFKPAQTSVRRIF